MKNIVSILFFVLLTQNIFAQTNNCADCNTKTYTEKDIQNLSLLELKILRNEIYARHQYKFSDRYLRDFFLQKYKWYKPKYTQTDELNLNTIEQNNIQLFKNKESEKINLQKTIITELKQLKNAVKTNNTTWLKAITTKEAHTNISNEFFTTMIYYLDTIFKQIDINDIHWYNEDAIFKITTDNGLTINETWIQIKGTSVIMNFNDSRHSELLNDSTVFSYGSRYDSISEGAVCFSFKLQNNRLMLIKISVAG